MRYAENLVGKPEERSFYFSDMKFILQRWEQPSSMAND
jgi:hypothetical protein